MSSLWTELKAFFIFDKCSGNLNNCGRKAQHCKDNYLLGKQLRKAVWRFINDLWTSTFVSRWCVEEIKFTRLKYSNLVWILTLGFCLEMSTYTVSALYRTFHFSFVYKLFILRPSDYLCHVIYFFLHYRCWILTQIRF